MCKDERLNSLTNSTAKNSNPFTSTSTVRNQHTTPITKLCPGTKTSDAFYSQAPQNYPPGGFIRNEPIEGAKVKNLSHPFMNEFVSQDEMDSGAALSDGQNKQYIKAVIE